MKILLTSNRWGKGGAESNFCFNLWWISWNKKDRERLKELLHDFKWIYRLEIMKWTFRRVRMKISNNRKS